MENILKTIERKHHVNKITVNGDKIWVFLRMEYFKAHQQTAYNEENIVEIQKKGSFKKIISLKNIFYGFTNWFKKYDYIAFSTSREGVKKIIKKKYYHRLIDPIIEEVGKESVLNIEKPINNHRSIKQLYIDNIVSYDLIRFIAYIIKNIYIKKYEIKNEHILQSIQDELNLKINYKRIIKGHYSLYTTFKLLYSLIKPKAIFVVCYYANWAAIKAAKDIGIKVIEIQHGVIGEEHPAYNIGVDLDNAYFPDYLFAYGKQDVLNFSDSYLIDQKNVIPIGSYYIDYLKESFLPDIKFQNIIKKYSVSVGITLENPIEKQTIDFVKEAAIVDGSVLFILIPRKPITRNYSIFDLPDNVLVITDKDFYELMMYVNYHSTVTSTCALEAPSFGVQNIMINLNNISKKYFEASLIDRITKYADTPKDYLDLIKSMDKLDKEMVYYLNEDIIMPNYRNNLKYALLQVLD